MVGFDLGGVEDAQEECKVGPHAEEEPNMDCDCDGGEDGERVRLLPNPRTPSKAEWERHVVSHMPLRDWCRHCVAGRGLERRHQRHPGHDDQYPLVCIDYGYLTGDATPMSVAKDRRKRIVCALPVERKGAVDPHAVEQPVAWVDMLGSSQVAKRSDGEPAVMQVAAAVRDARRAGSVTTLETSAPGDHAGNGLAERAVGLVGGMVRTLGFQMKTSEYILIANGEATTIRRRPVPERWANPEEIVNIPVWPWDRPGHPQAAAVRPMESDVIATTSLTKPSFPSHLLKQDRRKECT